MKKWWITLISLMLAGALAACSAATPTPAAGTNVPAANGTPGAGTLQLSALTRLILGTFALEGTDQAVTAEQAQTLVPLLQAVQTLGQSDTTAAAEMEALEAQIQGTFTAAQVDAIDALALTPQDMQAIMAEQGLTFGAGAEGTPRAADDGGGNVFGGGPPPDGGGFGGGPGGPGGPGGGGFNPDDLSPDQLATIEARRAGGGGPLGGSVPGPLLTALIELLQAKVS